jgi:hypothetical protein
MLVIEVSHHFAALRVRRRTVAPPRAGFHRIAASAATRKAQTPADLRAAPDFVSPQCNRALRLPKSSNAPTKESASIVALSDRRAVLQSERYPGADYGGRVREIHGDLIKKCRALSNGCRSPRYLLKNPRASSEHHNSNSPALTVLAFFPNIKVVSD